jgi:KDO2-lipid IV(A) lauroyltransferase
MIAYLLIVPVLFFFAYLPTGILYAISNVLAFTIKHIIRYRRKVVDTNLKISFPEKSEAERNAIAGEFYYHLSDRVIENLKALTITKEEIGKRVNITNPEILEEYYAQNRQCVFILGHIGSWEWGGYKASTTIKQKIFGIVSMVTNPHFNKLIQSTRGKMGMELISMKDAKEYFQYQHTVPSATIFIADQNPANIDRAYKTKFFGTDTYFFTGGERYARQHNCVVIFIKITQVKKGYYNIDLIPITKQPNSLPENAITQKFSELLEQQLRERPSDWLWSHKRWKHSVKY